MEAVAAETRKYVLPIAPSYVSHWGLWEAVREIYQNALDCADSGDCTASIDCSYGILRISTSQGALTPQSLVLGNSTKRNDPKSRGKFGEGYKLALLVLTRLGFHVEIRTFEQLWVPSIEFDWQFKSDVLAITVSGCERRAGVEFRIRDVSDLAWDTIQKNIRSDKVATVLDSEEEKGRIYVGGLYVTTLKGFQCGYSFPAGAITLDRDRGMVSGFDVSWKTSELWTERGGKRATELLEAEAPDVEHVEHHVSAASPIASYSLGHFRRAHGHNAIPVSSQEEIERATAAGVKWVLVSEKVKSVLRTVKSWFIPTTKSPLEQLNSFRERWQWSMNSEMKSDLDGIIKSMEPAQ